MALIGEDQYQSAPATVRLLEIIQKAQDCLFEMQMPTGEWCGELEGDSILESEFILLMYSLGLSAAPLTQKVAVYLRRLQTSEGGWSIFPDGPNDVSATVKAYFALKLMGDSPDDLHMRRAREVALRLGGVCAANSFTKVTLAVMGQYDWNHVPAIPPEITLLPQWFFFNIYAMSSWSRTILVPLAIIWADQPRYPVPEDLSIDELFVGGRENADLRLKTHAPFPSWRHCFLLVDRCLKILNSLPIKPWRKKAMAVAERWMKARFRKSAGLGAIFPPIVYSIWALRCLNYPMESAEIRSQMEELFRLVIEEADHARVQPCTSPVWDTALSCIALNESGVSGDSEPLVKAMAWVAGREVKEPGDWRVFRPNLQPGGWYFEYANEFYPDVDDTAMVLIAMSRMDQRRPAMERRALSWVMGMQCASGGWASFDADNTCDLLCEFPFADHNAMIDPPTADITGRVLEMLAAYGYNTTSLPVQRALHFLRHQQEPDGSWFGRWGVNYIYGTWQVIKGMTAVGVSVEDPSIVRGAEWLLSVQNADGGWGESCWSYHDRSVFGSSESTASQTAWALMGLIAAGMARHLAVERGVAWLIGNQDENGDWPEPLFTGTGFPKVFYLKYHLYKLYFPLFALGMYQRVLEMESDERLITEAGELTLDRS